MMQFAAVISEVPAVLPPAGGCRAPDFKHCRSSFDAKSLLWPSRNWPCPFSGSKLEFQSQKLRTRRFMVRTSGNSGGNLIPVAPLQLESPIGQLLTQILQTHPHLLLVTVDQQLENLQSQRDAQREMIASSSQDLLNKRIAEVKEKDWRKTLEDIVYCLIVQRFVENDISMNPQITTSYPAGRVDIWPDQEEKLESVHSAEAFEMILSHLSLVLGERVVESVDTIIQISKIKLGKLYAASIMYGYFLRRVDERFQLEQSMNTLPEGFGEDLVKSEHPTSEKQLWDPDSLIHMYPDDGDGEHIIDSGTKEKSYKLRSYVMYLDAETLQRYATIRSKEALSLIEKQTQALFGRPDIMVTQSGTLDASNDEVVSVTFSGLTLLILEAVTFGSFLWDTESYVESKYTFINS
ncbi:UV-B-induced protein At3g17800, chloroplastic [Henckelia pumila]|uniref:UV-B-induced protein At3g17800, chloroplastic n=1 Tax=Henckelia pumila TaxID=405737 RepID=UPI003C6DFCEB